MMSPQLQRTTARRTRHHQTQNQQQQQQVVTAAAQPLVVDEENILISVADDIMLDNRSSCFAEAEIVGAQTTSPSQHNTVAKIEKDNEHHCRQNQGVALSRALVFFVLVAAASALAGLTYHFVSTEQQEDMLSDFVDLGEELIDISQHNVKKVFGVLEGLSAEATAIALERNASWPFVTIPYFQSRIKPALKVSEAQLIAFIPIVSDADRVQWENYSIQNQHWIHQQEQEELYKQQEASNPIGTKIYAYSEDNNDRVPVEANSGPFAPVWQFAPPPALNATHSINYNLFDKPVFKNAVDFVKYTRKPVFLDVCTTFATWFSHSPKANKALQTVVVQPIFSNFHNHQDADIDIVGFFVAVLPWDTIFENILHDGAPEVTVVMENTCNEVFSFSINGQSVAFLGEHDMHDPRYTHMGLKSLFADFANPKEHQALGEHCVYTINVYPSESFRNKHISNDPSSYALVVIAIFVFTSMIFTLYDCLVQRRQMNLIKRSAQMHASLVSSLFPSSVRDRVIDAVAVSCKHQSNELLSLNKSNNNNITKTTTAIQTSHINDLDDSIQACEIFSSHPIADLFPEATVMFCDIAGFTAWSSMRGPEQVFTLLETVYHAFDTIAAQMGVFKVETIGDSYVAVCGLPEYRKGHAVVMAEFAHKCLISFNHTAQRLETFLGPETMDLKMRFGLHSGPVTAGVLRGQKARFQLFGDTVNTASRVESTGSPDRIQVSSETADLLQAANKGGWLERRKDVVQAKGKGAMETYWLKVGTPTNTVTTANTDDIIVGCPKEESKKNIFINHSTVDANSVDSSSNSSLDGFSLETDDDSNDFISETKLRNLIRWNCAILIPHLQNIVARRKRIGQIAMSIEHMGALETAIISNSKVADEVVEIIELPEFTPTSAASTRQQLADEAAGKQLDDKVIEQLVAYITLLASMYNNNAFHSFAHASHVVMSTGKLLSRIVAPTAAAICQNDNNDDINNNDGSNNSKRNIMIQNRKSQKQQQSEKRLYDHTYGITSDPLTQFSVLLAALIHDVDHQGVSNAILSQENPALGERYNFKSTAEQNSVDLAWNALMSDDFKALRRCIYCNESELKRFRHLIVNSVMATDIFDKDLSDFRKRRWQKAFSYTSFSSPSGGCSADDNCCKEGKNNTCVVNRNRRATIVIEYLIQASDVAHTMQHWHIYQQWNNRLFQEMYGAFLAGRTETDPSAGWYDGEIWFFDNYIIPLAKKLKDCGVFGVSSDEYLNYAIANRREWLAKGKQIVANNINRIKNTISPPLVRTASF